MTMRAAPSRSRGFTLIELLVATIAGLFVAVAAFALAKQGSRFFQSEARVSNAQFTGTIGFDRLRADIARAAFMSSPNIQIDPTRCGGTMTAWPAGVKSLAALRIDQSVATLKDDTNGLAPDTLRLSGAYTSAELYPIRTVLPSSSGTGWDVYLQKTVGPMTRTTRGAAITTALLAGVFRAGRMLRIVDSMGMTEYGAIKSASVNTNAEPVVVLEGNPVIPLSSTGATCGPSGFGTGMQANVVNWIKYELRDLSTTAPAGYAPLLEAGVPDDAGRKELVRVEEDATQTEFTDTLEVVAEWAVDLKVVAMTVASAGLEPAITEYLVETDAAQIKNYARDVSGGSGGGPERVRSIRTRLTVRSREADRAAGIPDGSTIYRYQLDAGSFARARTYVADIQLPNLAGIIW